MRFLLVVLIVFSFVCPAMAADYPIVCVKSVRPNDMTFIRFPEVFHATAHPPSDLILLNPDGTQEVLVSGNGEDALFDPKMSLDGKFLYYVKIPNCQSVNGQRGNPGGSPRLGADIYRYEFSTQKIVRVTDQKWTLPGSAGDWSDTPSLSGSSGTGKISIGYGVINLGPCPLPGGKLAFTSNRRGYQPPSGFAFPNSQLFILDDIPGETETDGEQGRNVECTGFLNVSSALHPTLMKDGRILWSSHESQGRDNRLWSIWVSYPDGREWGPVYSDLNGEAAWHFHGQRGDGSIFSTLYYNLNNNGTGAIYESPLVVDKPEFLNPDSSKNPKIPSGWLRSIKNKPWFSQFSTQRRGLYSVTPWSTERDEANGILTDDGYVLKPKVTHPSPAPNNGLLVTITPGPANNLARPVRVPKYHFKVGLISGKIAENPEDVEILLESAGHNFTQPIARVSWQEVYGGEPLEIPVVPNPSGTPFGVIGSSSAHLGQWIPVDGTKQQGFQSSTEGNETDKPPAGIDVVGLSPKIAQTYWGKNNDSDWTNKLNERARVLARVILNEPGRTDTSWAAQIPADVPFTFRTFDASGRTITWARTWHQVRPGETRVNCGGCHNHSGTEVKWEESWFVANNQTPKPFAQSEVRTPEFNRDVLPIFEAKCHSCHNAVHPVQLDASIVNSDYVVPGKAFKSLLSKAVHGEGTQMPPSPSEPLTDAEKLLIDEWIDYWCLVAEPGKADFDESPPTLYVSRSGSLKVGAYDYQSGLSGVTINGESVMLTNGVYTGPEMTAGETYTVVATDNAGSQTKIERFVRSDSPEHPPNDEIEQLKRRIADLEAEVTKQAAKLNRIVEIVEE